MKRMVDGILRQYGTVMTLVQDGVQKEIRGFFHPFRSTSWQNIVNVASPIGEISRRQYMFIGPADLEIWEMDTLILGNRHYLFRRIEPYYYGEELVYQWAMCVEKGVNEIWGTES